MGIYELRDLGLGWEQRERIYTSEAVLSPRWSAPCLARAVASLITGQMEPV